MEGDGATSGSTVDSSTRFGDTDPHSNALHSDIGTALTFANIDTAARVLEIYVKSALSEGNLTGYENTMSDAIESRLSDTIAKAAREAWPKAPSGQFTIKPHTSGSVIPSHKMLLFEVKYNYHPEGSEGKNDERGSTETFSYTAHQDVFGQWHCGLTEDVLEAAEVALGGSQSHDTDTGVSV